MVFSASKKYKNNLEDESASENDIAYPTSIASSAERMIYSCGFLLMICNLQNSIIVKYILWAH